jgi:4a-hydroxytetrahydrobiopterin dehydratase
MTTPLADMKCVACRVGTPPITPEEYAPLLEQLEGWTVEDGKRLVKPYRFKNFVGAVDFVNAITPIAEAEGHHPDLYVKWGEVRAYVWTHKIDNLTESDFVLAAKLDRAYAAQPRG